MEKQPECADDMCAEEVVGDWIYRAIALPGTAGLFQIFLQGVTHRFYSTSAMEHEQWWDGPVFAGETAHEVLSRYVAEIRDSA